VQCFGDLVFLPLSDLSSAPGFLLLIPRSGLWEYKAHILLGLDLQKTIFKTSLLLERSWNHCDWASLGHVITPELLSVAPGICCSDWLDSGHSPIIARAACVHACVCVCVCVCV
jgi:hypothetical protein